MPAPAWIRRQLSGPHGWLARPMARLLNRYNAADYENALAALGAKPHETVLELGFGGGVGVKALLDRRVRVIASEPAVAMRERAFRRFSQALADGRMEVWPHRAEELHEGEVHRALSMNTVYFWNDIDAGFQNLRRMVEKRVVFGIATPEHLRDVGFAREGFRVEPIEWYAERLSDAGFDTHIAVHPQADTAGILVGD